MAIVNAPGYPATLTRPRVSWGPIFAGAICTLGCLVLFTLLGAAIGFTAHETVNDVAPAVWVPVSWVLSMFLGGVVAGRLVGCERRIEAALHGLTAWALTLIMIVWLVGVGIGGAFGMVGQAATTDYFRTSPELHSRAGAAQERFDQTLQNPTERARAEERAADLAVKGAWVAFGTTLLAALAGFFGGLVGLPRRRTIEDAPGYYPERRVAPAM